MYIHFYSQIPKVRNKQPQRETSETKQIIKEYKTHKHTFDQHPIRFSLTSFNAWNNLSLVQLFSAYYT